MTHHAEWTSRVAERLAALHEKDFGGKKSGRYRIPAKLVRQLAKRRRLYEADIRDLARELFERGYILIDMESFYIVMSANAFVNYRRANDDCLT